MTDNAGSTHFGFRTVPTEAKKGLVREVFESVAPRYDLMNDLMSFGIHRVWKRIFVTTLGPRPSMPFVDRSAAGGDRRFMEEQRLLGLRQRSAQAEEDAAAAAGERDKAARRLEEITKRQTMLEDANVQDVLQHQPGFPFCAPKSHCSPGLTTPFPHGNGVGSQGSPVPSPSLSTWPGLYVRGQLSSASTQPSWSASVESKSGTPS